LLFDAVRNFSLAKEAGAGRLIILHAKIVSRTEGVLYPDDLDDTFAALIALHKYRPNIISGERSCGSDKIAHRRRNQRGWPLSYMDPPAKFGGILNDPDMVVNSTVGYFSLCSACALRAPIVM